MMPCSVPPFPQNNIVQFDKDNRLLESTVYFAYQNLPWSCLVSGCGGPGCLVGAAWCQDVVVEAFWCQGLVVQAAGLELPGVRMWWSSLAPYKQ